MPPSIESSQRIELQFPNEFDDIKNQKFFSETYKNVVSWYGDKFDRTEIGIIKGVWQNGYQEYKGDITKGRAVILGNRMDKGIFEYRYPDFKKIDETIIREIPVAEVQRGYRDIAITIEEKFQKLSEDEITIIKNEFLHAKNEFLNRKNKGKLPNADKIAAEITEYRLNNTAVTNFGGELSELENIITNPSITNTFHPSNDIGDNNDTNISPDNNLAAKIDNKHHTQKYPKWPSEDILQGIEQIKISPNFQDIENRLFSSTKYEWDKYGNEKYAKYFFRESVSFLESYNIDEIDDDTFLIIQNELRLIASGVEHDSDRLKQKVLEDILIKDEGLVKFKKVLSDLTNDLESLNDEVDEQMLRQMEDAEFEEEICYLEDCGISGNLYKKARAAQQTYKNRLEKGEELSEEEMALFKKLNIILGEDGKSIGKIIKLHKIRKIQKEKESKNFHGKVKPPLFEQVEGNIKSLNPDTIVHNNQNIHDYVFRENTDNYISFDGKIDAEYRKNLYQKLIKKNKNDIAFVESTKYLDEYGNINYKKAQAENIDKNSLQQNFKTIDNMIHDLAKEEYQDKEKIKKINDICSRKCIISTCFRALSNYFDTTNNNGENFADSFEIGDLNKDIDFNEETGIIKMKGKIGGKNSIGLYYDTQKGELSFDNFIGYNSNIGYVIGTNNGEKEKLNIKLPTMEEMERQSDKVDKDLIYKGSINIPSYIKILSKCINDSLWLGCFQGFIGTEMDVNKQFVKEFNEKNILKQEIFRSIYSKYYNQDSLDKIINDKLVISEGNEKEQYKLIKLISDSIDNCKNSNELLMFRNLITEFDKLVSQDYYVTNDKLLKTLFSNNLNDENDAYDQSIQIMKDENTDIVVNKNESGFYGNANNHTTNKALNYYTFLDLLAEDKGINRIINLSAFDNAINTLKTDGAELLDKHNGILWKNYGFKVVEGNIAEIVPIWNNQN